MLLTQVSYTVFVIVTYIVNRACEVTVQRSAIDHCGCEVTCCCTFASELQAKLRMLARHFNCC